MGTGLAMPLRIVKSEGSAEVGLVGEVDISNAATLAQKLREEVEQGGDLVLDVGARTFMESSGIRLRNKTSSDIHGRGRLKPVAPRELGRRALELMPVDRLDNVEIIDDEHA